MPEPLINQQLADLESRIEALENAKGPPPAHVDTARTDSPERGFGGFVNPFQHQDTGTAPDAPRPTPFPRSSPPDAPSPPPAPGSTL